MSNPETQRLLVELSELVRSRYFGKYRGVVTKVDEEKNMGLIKACVPEIYGEKESPWALPCVPFAGKNHGLVVLPEVKDGVWIEFEGGDPSNPIWTGCWWGSEDMPDPGSPKTRLFATSGGHKLILDDKKNEIHLLHSDGGGISISDSEIKLKIGSTQIVLSANGVSINKVSLEVR